MKCRVKKNHSQAPASLSIFCILQADAEPRNAVCVFLRFRQKNKPVRVSNAISSSANYAGELAPMRFRRLPGVTGPCPSTTLDKSFIYFLRYCTKAGFPLSTKIHKKKIPFPKFASLHRRNPQKRLFFRYFSAITVLFPAQTRR